MSRKRKLLIIGAILLSCFLLLPIISAWLAAGQIISPPRRDLQDYHRVILNNPENYGIEIKASVSQITNCPYLVISPHGEISERGRIIRSQVNPDQLLPFGQTIGNLVLFHGRRGRKEDLLSIAERFCAVGFRCIIIDLPAHGQHPESFTQYGAHINDGTIADNVLTEAAAKFKFLKQPAHLWGMSMGGAYANKALLDTGDVWKSAIIVCSFNSLPSVIDGKLSIIPKALRSPYHGLIDNFIKYRANFSHQDSQPKKWAESITTPVMIAHGTHDNLIPIDQGKELYQSYNSQKKYWVGVPGGGHDNILITPMPLYSEMANWLLKHSTNY